MLNLNSYAMVNQRKRVVNSFLSLLPKRQNMSRQQWEELARYWNGEDHDEPLREYCRVVVSWIRKYMVR